MSTPAPATPPSSPVNPSESGGRVGPLQAPGPSGRDAAAVLVAVLLRPDLWWTALGELKRLAPRLWWRTAPHLPLPDRRLWEFRMVTAYGRSDAVPTRADVVSFLEWCRAASASSSGSPSTPSRPGGHR